MAEDGKVIIGTELDDSGLKSGLNEVNKTAEKALGGKLAKAAKVARTAIVGTGTALAGLGVSAVKYNASMEQYATSFEVMTGSAERAAEMMDTLKEMGAKTPFQFEDLAKATQVLMSFGMNSEEAIDSFKVLGDLAQGNAQKLDSFSLSLGKMQSSGKVTLEYLNLMIENGFNPLQEISDRTGESMASLYERVSKGAVSVDEIKNAMKSATSEGGKFYESMDKQSKTLNGQLSTLKDNIQMKLGDAFASISEKLSKEVIPKLIEFVQSVDVEKIIESITSVIQVFKDLAPAIAIATAAIIGYRTAMSISNIITLVTQALNGMTVAQYALNLAMSLNPIGLVVAAIAALTAGLVILWKKSEGFREAVTAAFDGVVNVVKSVINSFVTFFTKTIPNAINSALSFIKKNWQSLALLLVNPIAGGLKLLYDNNPKFRAWADNVISTIKKGLSGIYNIGRDLVIGLWNGIKDVKSWLLDKIGGFCNDVWGGIKSFFGIHSPSKLLEDTVGKNLGLGIGIGLEDSTKDVLKDVDKFNKAVYDEFDKQVAWSGQTTWINPTFASKPSTQSAIMEALAGQQTQSPVELNFYDTQTDPDAIYQKFYQQQTMGLAREF